MLRLLYISTARHPHTDDSVRSILDVSRRNNLLIGVSGLLLAGGNRFLQVLEGPVESVEATFGRISKDPRHRAAVILNRETTDTRIFPNWAMGFQSAPAPDSVGNLNAEIAKLIESIVEPTLKAYFEGFQQRHAA